jgi:GNAT superfamily N-acetyltransferase
MKKFVISEQEKDEILGQYNLLKTKPYSDDDYVWFEDILPLGMDRDRLSQVENLYTTHYGDFGKLIFKINGENCHLNAIGVLPSKRKIGIGKKIMSEVINFCKSKGVNKITANISEKNIPSLSLIKSLGIFDENKEVDRYYDDGSKKLSFYVKI